MAKRYHSHMMPNDGGRAALVKEEMGNPCGLPMGAIQRVAESESSMSYSASKVDDLFGLVNKTLKEDASDMRSLTKPRNF